MYVWIRVWVHVYVWCGYVYVCVCVFGGIGRTNLLVVLPFFCPFLPPKMERVIDPPDPTEGSRIPIPC